MVDANLPSLDQIRGSGATCMGARKPSLFQSHALCCTRTGYFPRMTTSVDEYTNVRKRLEKLGCPELPGIVLLPSNFDSADTIEDMRQYAEAATVKTLFRSAGILYSDVFTDESRAPYIQNNSLEWVAPALFISAGLAIENPTLPSFALNIISEYVMKLLRGVSGEKTVSLDVIVEKTDGTCKKVSYSGPIDGLGSVADIARTVASE